MMIYFLFKWIDSSKICIIESTLNKFRWGPTQRAQRIHTKFMTLLWARKVVVQPDWNSIGNYESQRSPFQNLEWHWDQPILFIFKWKRQNTHTHTHLPLNMIKQDQTSSMFLCFEQTTQSHINMCLRFVRSLLEALAYSNSNIGVQIRRVAT